MMFPEAFLNRASQKPPSLLAVQGHVPGAVDIAYLSRASILLTILFFSYATSFPQMIHTQPQKYTLKFRYLIPYFMLKSMC